MAENDLQTDAIPYQADGTSGHRPLELSIAERKKFVETNFELLSPNLKIECFHGMILYHEQDFAKAEEFQQTVYNLKLKNDRKPQVFLYDGPELMSLSGGKIENLEEAFARCIFVFIILSENFVKDSWLKLVSHSFQMEAIENKEKKWCVLPVITEPRNQLKFKIPFLLNALKEVKFYATNRMFQQCLQAHLNSRCHDLVEIENKLLLQQFSYISNKVSQQEVKRNEEEFQACLNSSGVASRENGVDCDVRSNSGSSCTESPSETLYERERKEENNINDLEVDNGRSSGMPADPQSTEVKCGQNNTNCPYFLKKTDDKDLMRNYQIVGKASRSVGIIYGPWCSGTGFRVGSKYFATARHIVLRSIDSTGEVDHQKIKISKFYVKFAFLSHNERPNDSDYFSFTNIVYENADLDVAVLELKKENGKAFPPPVSVISDVNPDNPVYIIAHPHGEPQTLDPKVQLYTLDHNDVKKSIEWAKSKGINPEKAYHDIGNNSKVLFHCASQHGASGGLGVMVDKQSDEPEAVLMLLRGYPNFLYGNQSFTNDEKENFLIIEQGVLLSSVYDDIKNNDRYSDLVYDINNTLKD